MHTTHATAETVRNPTRALAEFAASAAVPGDLLGMVEECVLDLARAGAVGTSDALAGRYGLLTGHSNQPHSERLTKGPAASLAIAGLPDVNIAVPVPTGGPSTPLGRKRLKQEFLSLTLGGTARCVNSHGSWQVIGKRRTPKHAIRFSLPLAR